MKEIFTRRSVRKYDLTKKLTKEELTDIIKAGMASPTARNQQAWKFMIIDDESKIDKLANAIVKSTLQLRDCNTYIMVLGDNNAPVFNLHTADLGASQMNMMIYARSKNLGTCWVGVHGNPEREAAVREIFNIPDNLFPYSLMAIGYPSDPDCFKEVSRFDESKIYYNEF